MLQGKYSLQRPTPAVAGEQEMGRPRKRLVNQIQLIYCRVYTKVRADVHCTVYIKFDGIEKSLGECFAKLKSETSIQNVLF